MFRSVLLFTDHGSVLQSIALGVIGLLQEQKGNKGDSSCDHADDIHRLKGAGDFLNLGEHPGGRAGDDDAQGADDLIGVHELLTAEDITEHGGSQVGDAAGGEGNTDHGDVDDGLNVGNHGQQHSSGHQEVGERQAAAGDGSAELVVNHAPQEGDHDAQQGGEGQVPDGVRRRYAELNHHDDHEQAHEAAHDPQPAGGTDGNHPHLRALQQLAHTPGGGLGSSQNIDFFLRADDAVRIQTQLVGTSTGGEQERDTQHDDDDTNDRPDRREVVHAAGSGVNIGVGQGDHMDQEVGEKGGTQRCGHSIDAHDLAALGDIPVGDNTLHGQNQHAAGHVVDNHGDEEQGEVGTGGETDQNGTYADDDGGDHQHLAVICLGQQNGREIQQRDCHITGDSRGQRHIGAGPHCAVHGEVGVVGVVDVRKHLGVDELGNECCDNQHQVPFFELRLSLQHNLSLFLFFRFFGAKRFAQKSSLNFF